MDFIAVIRGAYLFVVLLLCVLGVGVALCAVVEIVLDFIRPERVMRTDHLSPDEAKRSRRFFRIMLTALLVLMCLMLWAVRRFVMLSVWSNFLEYIR